MPVFDALYARAYDILYADKDYTAEATFLGMLVERLRPGARSVLDLGSGTGRHARELTALGYSVTGVEMSSDMLARAVSESAATGSEKAPAFHLGDVRTVRLGSMFDVVTALFHVMSYQTSNEDLRKTLETARVHAADDGVFIFDYWYGPAVLTQRPSLRVKRCADDAVSLLRVASPTVEVNRDIVQVDYELLVTERGSDRLHRFTETHRMRYLFLPEIEMLAEATGWRVIEHGRWLEGGAPTADSWGVYTALVKSR